MAYRRTARVEARLAANRRRILQSARQLVSEGGFRNAPIENVAAAAGLAPGTVYRYFPSKADLMAEVFRTVVQREVDVMQAIADGAGTVVERLEGMIRTFAQRALQRPRLAYALLAEPIDPIIEAERLVYRESYARIFEQVIHEGMTTGELPPQEAHVVAACLGGAQAQALVGPLAPEHQRVPGGAQQIIDETVRFCMRAVTMREE